MPANYLEIYQREKENLLIDGQGKYPGYNYYKVAGIAIGGKGKGEAISEEVPVDVKSLMPKIMAVKVKMKQKL